MGYIHYGLLNEVYRDKAFNCYISLRLFSAVNVILPESDNL